MGGVGGVDGGDPRTGGDGGVGRGVRLEDLRERSILQ